MTERNDPTLPSEPNAHGDPDEAYCPACSTSFPADTEACPNDGARLVKLAARLDDLLGRQLENRYEIRAPLGKGGMGTVYRGWQLSVDREVAIKVVSPKLASDRNAVKRFLREARLASRLSHPNVVNVYDFGQAENVLYLVMELLRGRTLATELAHDARFTPKRAVTIAAQLCDALEAAHAQGIVHRDLKPGNVVILDAPLGRDLIKVLDFGLAKSLVQDSGSAVTNSDALLGTPLYMAPEQILGQDTDQRVDLYALGCILYEMLAGRPPHVDVAVSAVLSRHLGDTPEALPAHVPPKLRQLVEQLLAKRPEDRVQTASEARAILDEIRDGTAAAAGSSATPARAAGAVPDLGLASTHASEPAGIVGTSSTANAFPQVNALSSPEAHGEPPRRSRLPLVLGLGGVLLAAGATVALVARSSGSPPAKTSGPPATIAPAALVDAALPPAVDAALPPTVDAAVPVDAPADAARVDAGTRGPPKRRDAGASSDPEIDFHPSRPHP